LLINLTDIDGLFNKDPRVYKDARLIPLVEKVTRELTEYASLIPGFLGTGGMASKIQAARKITLRGVPAIIANGKKSHILKAIFLGDEEGTLFLPQETTLGCRKHWIAFTKSPKGQIIIDKGAEEAILIKGKSLLPSGIKETRGRFKLGDSVVILNEKHEEVAIGMVNYDSDDIQKIMGAKSNEIAHRLGYKLGDEVIHRDNLAVTNMNEGECV
jgi:glutamate 5-kinase